MANKLSLNQTADYLGISAMTVKNWEKQGLISSIKANKKNYYKENEVVVLKDQIEKGEINRLDSRANKKNSSKTFIPEDYLVKPEFIKQLQKIVDFIKENELKVEESLFALCLNLAVSKKIFSRLPLRDLLKHYNKNSLNSNIREEFNRWQLQLDFSKKYDVYNKLLEFEIPNESDILGIIYQSILPEGQKSKDGSYYTPHLVCSEMIEENYHVLNENSKILDPCCGTGQFLLTATQHFPGKSRKIKPENIWGYDINPVAMQLARMNLIFAFQEVDFHPNIYKRDMVYNYVLDDRLNKHRKFDLIVSNPPWGAEFRIEQTTFLKEHFGQILSQESFSYFLFLSLNLLSAKGALSFVLPESILNIKTHQDIRAFLLRNAYLKKIKTFGRIFKNVFSPALRLDISKSADINKNIVIETPESKYGIAPKRFLQNKDFILDIFTTPEENRIIEKIYSKPHTKLIKQADWALGIVTGNNKKYISESRKKGFEPIYRGKDIEKFQLKKSSQFIEFTPEKFQQTAAKSKYRAKEKLVYRFISNKLIFAYDNKKSLTLNSANILIPKIPDYPIEAILVFLNSSVFQFIFQKRFFTHKVLRHHIESLPIPVLTDDEKQELKDFCQKIMLSVKDKKLYEERLNEANVRVCQIFNLTSDEISIIQNSL
jgi:type I restriction-modification system DNA methylase subunit